MRRHLFIQSREALKAGVGIFLVLLGTNCCFLGAMTGAMGASGRGTCRAGSCEGVTTAAAPAAASHCGRCGHGSSKSAKAPARASACTTVSGAVQAPAVKFFPAGTSGPVIAFAAEPDAPASTSQLGVVLSTESPPPRSRAPASFQGRAPPLS